MKIGYQGIEESNSFNATKIFIKQENIKDAILVPLITSEKVVKSLLKKEIDIGICAINNTTAGKVLETLNALKDVEINIIKTIKLDIHHCLFVRNKNITFKNIKYIESHEQALRQCKNYIDNKFGKQVKLIKREDTSICAEDLSKGLQKDNTAVIVNRQAGIKRNLYLLDENIEDNKNNTTEFIIFKM